MDSHYRRVLGRLYGRRRWIVALDVLAGATSLVASLRDLDAATVLVIAGGRGTGALPDDVPAIVLGTGGPTIMDAIRAFERALGEAAPYVTAAVDWCDPDGQARVIAGHFSGHATVAGRPVHGARPSLWKALEDKIAVEAVWRDAGVPQAPSMVVEPEPAALRAAAAALDGGQGTVWVADNRRGWHGGAMGLRWVRTPEQADTAAAFLAEQAYRVRVMPFLDGIPCSIHGVVVGDVTIALRPCEMVVLRRPGRSDLLYAGMGSTWDPPPEQRDVLRSLARRVGDHLRRTVGYRGVFTIDGVMTRDGFRPTELNPRCGAGAGMLAAAAGLPLYLMHLAIVDGAAADWRPQLLEHLLVTGADRTRAVHSTAVVRSTLPEREVALRWDGAGMTEAGGAPADVTVVTGASPAGGAVRVVVDVNGHPRGRSVAGVVAASLTYADQRWELGLGALEPATDVTA